MHLLQLLSLSEILIVAHQDALSRFARQYAARDVTVIDNRIVITCSDASEALRAKLDAISFGLRASTAGNQLILYYDDIAENNTNAL